MCFKNVLIAYYRLLKFDRIFFESLYLYVGESSIDTTSHSFQSPEKGKKKKKKKYMRENTQNMFSYK